MNDPTFHCGICPGEGTGLAAYRRQHHAGVFPMKNGCEIQQCAKWQREHPDKSDLAF